MFFIKKKRRWPLRDKWEEKQVSQQRKIRVPSQETPATSTVQWGGGGGRKGAWALAAAKTANDGCLRVGCHRWWCVPQSTGRSRLVLYFLVRWLLVLSLHLRLSLCVAVLCSVFFSLSLCAGLFGTWMLCSCDLCACVCFMRLIYCQRQIIWSVLVHISLCLWKSAPPQHQVSLSLSLFSVSLLPSLSLVVPLSVSFLSLSFPLFL